mmetsp:Transcript_19986/g.44465  ORF Transcript_19986/g.44465 Transcript_19986/m.44465 type:complete len:207 (-) Transcript_19986:231-851(-)
MESTTRSAPASKAGLPRKGQLAQRKASPLLQEPQAELRTTFSSIVEEAFNSAASAPSARPQEQSLQARFLPPGPGAPQAAGTGTVKSLSKSWDSSIRSPSARSPVSIFHFLASAAALGWMTTEAAAPTSQPGFWQTTKRSPLEGSMAAMMSMKPWIFRSSARACPVSRSATPSTDILPSGISSSSSLACVSSSGIAPVIFTSWKVS